jgi:hypothetical protein
MRKNLMYRSQQRNLDLQKILWRIRNPGEKPREAAPTVPVPHTPVQYTAREIEQARAVLNRLLLRADTKERGDLTSIRVVRKELYSDE